MGLGSFAVVWYNIVHEGGGLSGVGFMATSATVPVLFSVLGFREWVEEVRYVRYQYCAAGGRRQRYRYRCLVRTVGARLVWYQSVMKGFVYRYLYLYSTILLPFVCVYSRWTLIDSLCSTIPMARSWMFWYYDVTAITPEGTYRTLFHAQPTTSQNADYI